MNKSTIKGLFVGVTLYIFVSLVLMLLGIDNLIIKIAVIALIILASNVYTRIIKPRK